MALGSDFEARSLVNIEADNRSYLRAVAQVEAADKRAAEQRDAALARTLKAQGILTQEAFATAKAMDAVSLPISTLPDRIGKADIAMKAFAKKVTDIPKDLGKLAAGFGIGLAVGAIDSLLGKIIAPPPPDVMDRWITQNQKGEAIWNEIARHAERVRNAQREQNAMLERRDQLLEESYKAQQRRDAALERITGRKAFTESMRTLQGIGAQLTPEQYFAEIQRINEAIPGQARRPARRGRGRGGADEGGLLGGFFDLPERRGLGDIIDAEDRGSRALLLREGRELTESFEGIDWDSLHRAIAESKEILANAQGDYLEQTFGKIERFDAYAAGFDLLTGAVTTAFDAWITGSTGVADAIKKFLAEGLRATATEMLMKSLQHSAYALGMIAFGNPAGATAHGKAAAAFAAGALVVGAAARGLHGGGGESSPGAAGAPAVGVSGGGAGGRGETTIVYVTDPYAPDSARARRQEVDRQQRRAKRGVYRA